jgi:hypothetical protein
VLSESQVVPQFRKTRRTTVDVLGVEEVVELLGIRRVEANPTPGAGHAGAQAAFQMTLQIQGDVGARGS